jgi:hypothetical protein
MEKTEFNKAKLFAQYYGQKVYHYNNWDDYATGIMQDHWLNEPNACLILRPLSSITDDEAIEVAKLQDWEYTDRKDIIGAIKIAVKNEWFNYSTCDYLRSKGFALPYMGLSVEKQIEYGWIKLSGISK